MELYGIWCPAAVIAPVTCIGLSLQYAALHDLIFPSAPVPLPHGEEIQQGWAALPDDLLARILDFVLLGAKQGGEQRSGPLIASVHSRALRSVCRSWRRVHDSKCVRFLKPCALHLESITTRFPGLVALDLSRCKYADGDAIFSLCGRLSHLTSLTLKDAGAGPRLAAVLADALQVAPKLQVLNLSANGIGAKGAASLADALRLQSCSLRCLNVRDNLIPAVGAVALATALRHNAHLTELDVSANPIGHEGAVALSSALVHNTRLRVLNLGACGVGDDGAAALAQSLSGCSTLESLSLFTNHITDVGAQELASAAGSNAGPLHTLELRGNAAIKASGVLALASAALSNGRLRHIFVDASPPVKPGSHAQMAATAAHGAALAELQRVLEDRV
jgi:hypothetical protein